ncbi:MAG: hypothetical protein J0I06_19625 [Planctomycetes bacterium]|nr:hypothetical protein [Planctomycetota bacterium]
MFAKLARWLSGSRSARPARPARPARVRLSLDPLEHRITPSADLVIDNGEVWNVGDAPSGPYQIREYYSHSATLDDTRTVVVGTIDMPGLAPNQRATGFDANLTGGERDFTEVGSNGPGQDHLDPALQETATTNVPYDPTTWTVPYQRYQDYLFNTNRFYRVYEVLGLNSGGTPRQYGSYVEGGFRAETPGFDLTAQHMSVGPVQTFAPGQQFQVILTVHNQGSVASPPKAINFLLMRDPSFDDHIITPIPTVDLGPRDIIAIQPGGSVDVPVTLTVPQGIGSGTWYVQAVLDPVETTWGDDTRNGDVDPANNNFSVGLGIDSAAITVDPNAGGNPGGGGGGTGGGGTGGVPNYRGHSFTVDAPPSPASSFRPGDTITVRYSLDNTGTASAPSLTVGFYLEPLGASPAVSTSDRRLGTDTISNFTTATTPTIVTQFTVPTLPSSGTYTLGMIIDPNNAVSESNEADNMNRGPGIDLATFRVDVPVAPPVLPPVVPPPPAAPSSPPPSTPYYSGATGNGESLIVSGAGVPGGSAYVPLPAGSLVFFTDLNGDGNGDVILFLPDLVVALDGTSGRTLLLAVDLNGDGLREVYTFAPDGNPTRIA